jgi:hypothetical protein
MSDLSAIQGNIHNLSEGEVDAVSDQCLDAENDGGSKFPGMSYEQGIKAAFDWLAGYGSNPMDD